MTRRGREAKGRRRREVAWISFPPLLPLAAAAAAVFVFARPRPSPLLPSPPLRPISSRISRANCPGPILPHFPPNYFPFPSSPLRCRTCSSANRLSSSRRGCSSRRSRRSRRSSLGRRCPAAGAGKRSSHGLLLDEREECPATHEGNKHVRDAHSVGLLR